MKLKPGMLIRHNPTGTLWKVLPKNTWDEHYAKAVVVQISDLHPASTYGGIGFIANFWRKSYDGDGFTFDWQDFDYWVKEVREAAGIETK